MIEQDNAVAAAEEWLALLDGEVTTQPVGNFQPRSCGKSRDPGQIAQSLRSVLVPLGAPLCLSLDGADYHKALPGAPDGRYRVLRFTASYTQNQAMVETVTLTWDHNGWHASGYFIR